MAATTERAIFLELNEASDCRDFRLRTHIGSCRKM
jgi:hypothetical protein